MKKWYKFHDFKIVKNINKRIKFNKTIKKWLEQVSIFLNTKQIINLIF
jgi:hypothetical protein